MERPTLQEIADMPHTEGVIAMRAHYDPNWPMVTKDPVEGEALKEYEVEVHYSWSSFDSVTVKVKAMSEEEAEEMAEALADKKIPEGGEVEGIKILNVEDLDG